MFESLISIAIIMCQTADETSDAEIRKIFLTFSAPAANLNGKAEWVKLFQWDTIDLAYFIKIHTLIDHKI